ncbi:MAG: hypothetical protein IPK55_11405 [Streptococcus sp.]|nr:hypothetical protein [Streptococcus sp.]
MIILALDNMKHRNSKQGNQNGEKLKDRAPEDLPGPGNYDQKGLVGDGPKYSMFEKRDTKYNDNPGPG